MIKPIMTKRFFLRRPSTPATADDLPLAQDLEDTLQAHRATCVGMAANMIGELKRIIAVLDAQGDVLVMLNPTITHAEGPYQAQEGCLSLEGVRPAMRYQRIRVAYQDMQLRSCEKDFSGPVAQAIQHEVDHCDGIVI